MSLEVRPMNSDRRPWVRKICETCNVYCFYAREKYCAVSWLL